MELIETFKALARRCANLLRFKEFVTATPEGRSQERYRRIALSALAGAGGRGVTILTTLVTVPLTLHYLGAERYGMWLTMASLIAFLGLSNFGIGAGLRNALTEAHGRGDREAATHYVSSAIFLLVSITLLLALIFALLYPIIPWPRIFNVKSTQALAEAGPAVLVLFACFLLKQALSIIDNIQIGYQESYKYSIWLGIGNILGLAGVLLAIFLRAGLPWLVLGLSGGPVVASLINGIILFSHDRPWLRPKLVKITRYATRKVTQIGLLFFVLQIANILGNETNNLILAQMLGAAVVPQFNVPMKLFFFTPLLLSFFLDPLWPAYGEAITRGDNAWVKKTFKRSILFSLSVTVPSAILLVAFAPWILHIWVGDSIQPSWLLLIGFGIWTVLNSILGPFAMLFNGINIIKLQVICWGLNGIINLLLSIVFVHLIGIPGTIYGTIISYVACVMIPFCFYLSKLFKKMK